MLNRPRRLLAVLVATAAMVLPAPVAMAEPNPDAIPVAAPGPRGPGDALPDGPDAFVIDDYGNHSDGYRCSPKAKPGARDLADIIEAALGVDTDIQRACDAGGVARSRHKMGLAIDVKLSARRDDDAAKAAALIDWLLETDSRGNPHARARRLGVTEIIWSDRIWRAAADSDRALGADTSTWARYRHPTGCESASCRHRDHVHLSMSTAGGAQETSWWTLDHAGEGVALVLPDMAAIAEALPGWWMAIAGAESGLPVDCQDRC